MRRRYITEDSHATSVDSVTDCSAARPRSVVRVDRNRAVRPRPRSMRLPMSMMVQPMS
ncbi:Uncharacterised protein [Mycobacteroides abscessus subsp. abscessus]|nr:Uncharacterised protein [Mycobacteroides abscessus subsp. abscessus]